MTVTEMYIVLELFMLM